MTLATCLRLYNHFKATNQRENAEEMRKRLLRKYNHNVESPSTSADQDNSKSEDVSNGKKPKR